MSDRLALLRAEMERENLDAVRVTSAENHLYFSRFDNPDGELLITKERAYVFADFRYIEAAQREADASFTVIMPKGARKEWYIPILNENGVRNLGYEDANLTCQRFDIMKRELEDVSDLRFTPVGGMLENLRSVKTEDEIEKIVAAQRIAEAALEETLRVMTPSMTEIEVAAELEYRMKKRGSQKPSFDTIAVSGKASSSPHGVPRNVPLEKGFLTMDFGAIVDGYHSDMTRTIVIGKADAGIRKVYETVLAAQAAAFEVIREGAKNADVDGAARAVIEDTEFKGTFGHGLGHGVGLLIHEQPSVSAKSGDRTLRAGEIITNEPGIYIAGKYGCRIEDTIHILPGGSENLTLAPKELIEI